MAPSTLAGDRMMTVILSRLTQARIEEITLDRDLDVLDLTPRKRFVERLIPVFAGDADGRLARDAFAALMRDPTPEPLFAGRTFSEALAFRLHRFFDEHQDAPLRLVPGRYEVIPASAPEDRFEMGGR